MTRVSRFTPWQTPRSQLEAIFVGRESILSDLVTRATLTAANDSRIHTLIVGPRGSGKTHLLAMLYYKLQDAIKEGLRIQIARLPEDPITIVSYPRLLAAIVTTVTSDQPAELDASALELSLDRIAEKDGPILVLLENLDEVFAQIGVDGQRKLRHYLQTSKSLLLITTTSVLDRSISSQDSPFYSFFSVISLQPLTVPEAQKMLINLARVHEDEALAGYLENERVKAKLEIASHLAGSHPRIWSIFSEILTPESLDKIADLLFASFDDLAPYYRDRLMSLTPQQRLVISELAQADHPLHVQEIAKRAQLDERSAARTVAGLKEAGWIDLVITPWSDLLDGRRTYYELSEPLVRLAFQSKEVIGRPIDLIVNFLSIWFDPYDLTHWNKEQAIEYASEIEVAFSDDAVLRMTRRLSRLPQSRAKDVDLLGDVDDALADAQSGDAQALMALPSQVRKALEREFSEAPTESGVANASLRRILHRAAMDQMGWVAHEPQSSDWISRGENLASSTGSAEDFALWTEWLARSWRFDQAESVLHLIAEDIWRLRAQDNLATAYESAGDLKRAVPLFEQTLAEFERVLGDDHPDTLLSRNNLASAYQTAGDLKRAIPLYEQTRESCKLILGVDHPLTKVVNKNLAIVKRSTN